MKHFLKENFPIFQSQSQHEGALETVMQQYERNPEGQFLIRARYHKIKVIINQGRNQQRRRSEPLIMSQNKGFANSTFSSILAASKKSNMENTKILENQNSSKRSDISQCSPSTVKDFLPQNSNQVQRDYAIEMVETKYQNGAINYSFSRENSSARKEEKQLSIIEQNDKQTSSFMLPSDLLNDSNVQECQGDDKQKKEQDQNQLLESFKKSLSLIIDDQNKREELIELAVQHLQHKLHRNVQKATSKPRHYKTDFVKNHHEGRLKLKKKCSHTIRVIEEQEQLIERPDSNISQFENENQQQTVGNFTLEGIEKINSDCLDCMNPEINSNPE